MPHRDPDVHFRVIWLPKPPDPRACRHLASFHKSGKMLRFHRQTTSNILLAPDGREVLRDREDERRQRSWVRRMKALGFYRNRP
jgi:Leu/Phe-tRNA-protein transferase